MASATLTDDIRDSWSWLGVEPASVVRVNKFGNVVFADAKGRHWRVCPEELECKCIAESTQAFERLAKDPDFVTDWEMSSLVAVAEAKFGAQPPERCFCLKIPGVLGGEYDISNIGTISIGELMRFCGDAARQIKDLPPGSQVRLKVVE